MDNISRTLCGLIPVVVCAAATMAQPRFASLPGMYAADAISSNGQVVVGVALVVGTPYGHAVRWMVDSGTVDIHSSSIAVTSEAQAVNADGSVITGKNGWIWTSAAGMQPFTIPDHNPPFGTTLSRDGSIMAGYALNNTTSQFDAFLWSAAGGVVILPNVSGTNSSKINAISPAANLVVGSSSLTWTSTSNAAAWNPYSNAIDLRVPGQGSSARAVTPDGVTIVGGVSNVSTSTGNAAIWTANGVQILPNPADRPNCTLGAVSDAGDFACGASVANGGRAVVWLRSGGIVDGAAFLTSRGVTVPGPWALGLFSGVTPDGRTIVGSGGHIVNSETVHEGFIVHLCSTADYNHDGNPGTDTDIADFFACLGGQCCTFCDGADINNDGDVGTDADIESFFRILAGQPC